VTIVTLNTNVFQDVAKKNSVQLPIDVIIAAVPTTIAKIQTVAVIRDALTIEYAWEIKTKEIIANTAKNAKV
jgi:hypothetical protein